ncbi:MAG TPA: DUF2059 domain-containing protein [Terracidiphilus sp.]|nr:DUF2059 domain-containing protein [Terracidiphilus sp.]
MKKAIWTIAVAALALAPCAAIGQTPAAQPAAVQPQEAAAIPADQQATQEQMTKLFEVMRLREQMNRMMAVLPAIMKQQVHAQEQAMLSKFPEAKQLTPEQQAALDKLMDKYMQQAMQVYPTDEMLSDATSIYRRHMTRADADAYIAFYSSPPGQHLLDAQPQIMKEYMAVVMQKMQERSKNLYGGLSEDLKEFIAAQAPKSTAPAAKTN